MEPTSTHTEEVLSLASEAGHILLENGAEISRVEETMERIADHYGEQKESFFVLSNGIFTTGRTYANVEFIPIKGASLDKVVYVNQLSRDICNLNYSIPEAREKLRAIRQTPPKPVWEQLVGAAASSGGFCAIFGGSFIDCAAALVAGTIVYMFVLFASRFFSKALGNIVAGAIGTAACIIFQHLGFGSHMGNMMVGTLIPLIPGVAFTNGLRDIANEDYLSGITRLMDAIMVFLCIAIGVMCAFIIHSWIAGGMIEMHGTLTDPATATIPIQMLAALISTSSFAVLFGVPRRFYLSAGLVGMIGWLVYLVTLRYASLGVFGATFLAATVVAILSRYFAFWQKCPSTIFLICGIFPLIPGAGVFWSAYYIVSEQMRPALGAGFTAVKCTIAIVLGIIIAANVFHKHRKVRKSANSKV